MHKKVSNVNIWKESLQKVAHAEKIKILSHFFKTGKGEYGEGDIFMGITVPDNRSVAKQFFNVPLNEIEEMITSPIHEHRLSALIALVERYRKSTEIERAEIVAFYLSHTVNINNWDLVDLSAPRIIGEYTMIHGDKILHELSLSDNLWEKRIAIVSTMTHIRKGKYDTAMFLAEKYFTHPHDLIHKATGWMLREIGKRDEPTLIRFLDINYKKMPRTALRYALERLSPPQRAHYMKK